MDNDITHAVKAELEKLHARIDSLVEHNNLSEPTEDESTETAEPTQPVVEGQ